MHCVGITLKKERRYLTQWELKGLNVLIEWLDSLPPSKKSVPKDIHDPSGLVAEMRVKHVFHWAPPSSIWRRLFWATHVKRSDVVVWCACRVIGVCCRGCGRPPPSSFLLYSYSLRRQYALIHCTTGVIVRRLLNWHPLPVDMSSSRHRAAFAHQR